MRAKSYRGKVYGVEMTAAERQAMNKEIDRQILEKDRQYAADLDAMVLVTLMEAYGWKGKRLRKFWDAFIQTHKSLRQHYEMHGVGDQEWLAHQKLKEIGVDVHQWYKEELFNENQT
jgi:hypothetical protein